MVAITTTNLKKTYANGVQAVRDVNLDIKKGEVFGFLGPNGAGKSTCIEMLSGSMRPTDGSVKVLGLDFPDNAKEIADRIGYVPQSLVFFEHLTVEENLELYADCYDISNKKERISEVMEALKLVELRKRKSKEMSGGQKRRLNVAIGLLSNPDILFLDEPSAGMDPQSRKILWEFIRSISSSMTIILTTHLMEVADQLSDRIAIIDGGKIQVVDTPINLKKRYGGGDILHIQLTRSLVDKEELAIGRLLREMNLEDYSIDGEYIEIKTLNALNMLQEILGVIRATLDEGSVKRLEMRENTLEDVFIDITGYQLKEVNA